MLKLIGNVLNMTNIFKRLLSGSIFFLGKTIEIWVNLSHRSIEFRDKYGFNIYLKPGDEISLYYNRRSITDSTNIIDFLFMNCKEKSICFDLGANMGSISLVMWRKAGINGKVISIEADPYNIDRIKTNLLLNNFPTNYVKNVAIADKEGVLQLRRYIGINGWQTVGNPTFAESYDCELIKVSAISFSNLMDEYNLDSVDIVKIDIEGAELLALQGMGQYLKNKKIGCVIFEVNYLMLEGCNKSVADLMIFWNNYDYELWKLTQQGSLEKMTNQWPENFIGDCVAIPK